MQLPVCPGLSWHGVFPGCLPYWLLLVTSGLYWELGRGGLTGRRALQTAPQDQTFVPCSEATSLWCSNAAAPL